MLPCRTLRRCVSGSERGARAAWHLERIVERFGLLTVIVLGEAGTPAARAVQEGLNGEHLPQLCLIMAAGPS
ncbi:hypothetical protein [Streptomyces sp. YS-3]|uniref:hypothetical protein n=1 Tax=Streptomyces sp. YS-3 TaxID=3381352 RepID=UPI0038629EED